MASLVHRPSMFLLLLVCGPAFSQAMDAPTCPLLNMLAMTIGKFSSEEDGAQVESTVIPVDNPTLNKNFPLYIVSVSDGKLRFEGIRLVVDWDGTSLTHKFFMFKKTLSKYRNPELDLSTITRGDLRKPGCVTKESLNENGDIAMGIMSCDKLDIWFNVKVKFQHTCTWKRKAWKNWGRRDYSYPKKPVPPPVDYNKTVQYPMPESWLEGNEDCKSFCYCG